MWRCRCSASWCRGWCEGDAFPWSLAARAHEMGAQERAADPAQQPRPFDGLAQVVVGAQVQRLRLGVQVLDHGQEDDGDLTGREVAAQLAEQLEAVEPGHL